MNRFRLTLNIAALVLFTLAASLNASAQATRTWVSGTGSDADPCSYTAPCKTFASAISKTLPYGEVSVKDSGAYGQVTITKSVTIDARGHLASILASGGAGVTINISDAGDVDKTVRLRGLTLNGTRAGSLGPGTRGVRILAAEKVYIEDCLIDGFTATGTGNGRGISDERVVEGGKLFVTNTTVRNNGANGIVVFPGAGAAVKLTAVLDRVNVYGNELTGVYAGIGSRVTIKDSNITSNDNAGVQADEVVGTTEVTIERSVISHNKIGVYAGPGTPVIRMSETTVTHNETGLQFANGAIYTFGNCRIEGNDAGNTPTQSLGEQ